MTPLVFVELTPTTMPVGSQKLSIAAVRIEAWWTRNGGGSTVRTTSGRDFNVDEDPREIAARLQRAHQAVADSGRDR